MATNEYDREADKMWARNPQEAMRRYGLPCWHGHYGGCTDCDQLTLDDVKSRSGE